MPNHSIISEVSDMRRHLLGILVEQGWVLQQNLTQVLGFCATRVSRFVKVCRVCDGLSMFELGKPRKTYENLP